MNRYVAWSVAVAVVVVSSLAGSVPQAGAIPAFKKEFEAKYVKPDGNEAEKEYAAKVKKANCNVCHKGKTKKERNAYGNALADLLDKKEDEKNVEKIREALGKVAGMKAKPEDAKTFGELISEGQLPSVEEEPAK